MGTASLGYYDMAYRISLIPITDIGDVIAKVTFPIYVKISHDKRRLQEAFIKSFLLVVGIVVPIGIVLFIFPKEIVTLVLGEKVATNRRCSESSWRLWSRAVTFAFCNYIFSFSKEAANILTLEHLLEWPHFVLSLFRL